MNKSRTRMIRKRLNTLGFKKRYVEKYVRDVWKKTPSPEREAIVKDEGHGDAWFLRIATQAEAAANRRGQTSSPVKIGQGLEFLRKFNRRRRGWLHRWEGIWNLTKGERKNERPRTDAS